MSLLDDVSIVVTPNGYKEKTLFGVIPVPTEGVEESTYPNFTNSDISQWKIASSRATPSWDASEFMRLTYDVASGSALYATFGQTLNSVYKVTMRVRGTKSDGTTAQGSAFGSVGDNGVVGRAISNPTLTSAWQDYEFYAISTGSTFRLYLGSATIGDLVDFDSISVKEYTSADMDVTRATAATRVDENGLVNYAEVLGGEEIDNGDFHSGTTAWSFGGGWSLGVDSAEATSGSSGKLSQTKTLNGKYAQVTLTVSNYGGAGLILIDYGSTGSAYITSDGTHTLYGTYDQDIFEIYKSATFSGNVTNISVKEVTRDNVPRIDYTGGGCPHILAEPMRTNLFDYSEDFSNWNIFRSSLTPNETTSPDGTTNADLVEQDYPTTSVHGGLNNPTDVTTGVEYTYSFFVKKKEYSWIELAEAATSASNVSTWFDVENGVVGNIGSGSTAQIEDFGNGWYRCSISFTSVYTASRNFVLYLSKANGSSTADIVGGVYVWGAQLEAGSYATSYIPNFGTALGVTRNQDIFTRDGIGSLINSTEGVLFVEASTFVNGADCRITISDGTITNRVSIEWDILANTIKGFVGSDGNLVSPATYNQTDYNKIAIKYKENDCALWINGTKVDTDFAVSVLSGVNQLEFSNYGGSLTFEGKVKQLQVYDTALGGSPYDATLSDARLAALTSL